VLARVVSVQTTPEAHLPEGGLEVRIYIVLGTAKPCFECCDEWILADLYKAGSPAAFLVDDGGSTGNNRFLRDAVKITGAALNVGTGFVEVVPGYFRQAESLVWFN